MVIDVEIKTSEEFLNELIHIEKYLKQFPKLHKLYIKSMKYLPTLEGKTIYVEPFKNTKSTVLGYARKDQEKDVWYIGFAHHPPDTITFLHELIHVAGGDELSAYNYAVLLYYAIRRDLPRFNILDLLKLDLKTINKVMNDLFGFKGIEEYFEFTGVLPSHIADFDYVTGKVKLKEDVDEDIIVQTFIAEMAGGISVWFEFDAPSKCETIDCRIFEEIAKQLSH
ncbi:MAG: hypothetical protein QW215_00620 [Ignisphaera sp.]|uniref:Uncharacterized protein n=1 Tax=Ignisphaera aggregans TaxID=334771 RepID=A0A7C4H2J8_9CREN